jgi:hypothetical protein
MYNGGSWTRRCWLRRSTHRAGERLLRASLAGAGVTVTDGPTSAGDTISAGECIVPQQLRWGDGACGWLERLGSGAEWQGISALAPPLPPTPGPSLDWTFDEWNPSTSGRGHSAAMAVFDTSQQTPATIATRTRRRRATLSSIRPACLIPESRYRANRERRVSLHDVEPDEKDRVVRFLRVRTNRTA